MMYSLKKVSIAITLIGAFLGIYYGTPLHSMVDAYAISAMQQQFGSKAPAPDQEAFIRTIALEMGVTEPLIIRIMNSTALQTFGYHNAFAAFYTFFGYIPICPQPFLFVSEGFFEDLSSEEQRFLIGHEMVHIKEQHCRYTNLMWLIAVILLTLVVRSIHAKHVPLVTRSVPKAYQSLVAGLLSVILFYTSLTIPKLTELAYRRHIERVADTQSLAILASHSGGIKLIERWEKEFNLPAHNPYWDLFSDHPSNFERKQYCLSLSHNLKDNA